MKTLLRLLTLTFFLLATPLTWAQIPPTQYSQGISYITGGVGDEGANLLLGVDEEHRTHRQRVVGVLMDHAVEVRHLAIAVAEVSAIGATRSVTSVMIPSVPSDAI